LHGAARWPPKRLSFIRQFNLHNSYFILALPPGGATGGGEKSGTRDFIEPIRSFEPTPERNPMARSASAQRLDSINVSRDIFLFRNSFLGSAESPISRNHIRKTEEDYLSPLRYAYHYRSENSRVMTRYDQRTAQDDIDHV
jgi:hypothetical protein